MPNHTAHSNHTLQVAGLCLSWSNDQLEYQSQQKQTPNATLQQKTSLINLWSGKCQSNQVFVFWTLGKTPKTTLDSHSLDSHLHQGTKDP